MLGRDLDRIFLDTYYHGARNNERRIIEDEALKLWNYANTKEAFGCTWSTLEKVMSCNLNQDNKCIS